MELKMSLTKLIQLINTDNHTSITEADVTVGLPVAWSAEGNYRNTQILVSGVLAEGYVGQYTFYYRRTDLGVLFNAVLPAVTVPHEAATTAHVVASLNAQYPTLDLSVDDVDQVSISDDATSYTVRARSTSYYWIGEVEVIVEREVVDISTVFTVSELKGFDYATL